MNKHSAHKPKIGIALGGGGAKGYAHIGILKTLHQHGIECSVVAGTSIGSLVGAVYSAGKLAELEKLALRFRLTEVPLLLSPTWSTSGFFSGKNGLELMMKLIEAHTIEELPLDFGAVSVDLVNGEPVHFTSGSLRQALRASIAIPGLFTPVRVDGRLLVDGGLLTPVPVTLAKTLGADYIIAVDLFSDRNFRSSKRYFSGDIFPRELSSALNYFRSIPEKIFKTQKANTDAAAEGEISLNLIEVIENTLAVTQQALTKATLAETPPNVILTPKVNQIGILDFHRAEMGIKLGVEAAEALIPTIKEQLNNPLK